MSGLFARNFDIDLTEAAALAEEVPDAGPPMVTLAEAQQMADQARHQGYEQGLVAGAARALAEERESRTARSDEALGVLADSFADLAHRDQRLRTEVELEVAELVMGVGERILPDLFEAHMGDLLLARVHKAMNLVSGTGRVAIRVPPELQDSLAPRIAALVEALGPTSATFETVADAQIDDGTIRVDWQNGFLAYDPALAGVEALETLREAIIELRSQLESTS